jgi:autotransporter family porin
MATNVIYVKATNDSAVHDGKSWTTAFKTIHEGLDAAEASGGEVWVAQGVYKPTDSSDREVSFRLRPGVDLYGGFVGNETSLEQREWEKNETILSGDISGDGDKRKNSRHIVIGCNDAIIDGFTIRDGCNYIDIPGRRHHMTPHVLMSSTGEGVGAGILNLHCAPTVRNCVISDNEGEKGAAMYNLSPTDWPPFSEYLFPTVINCTFARNYSVARGGAVSNDLHTHPTFVNCSFIDNSCDGKGGAMYNDFHCSPTVVNCLFARNTAMKGGGMANDGYSSPKLTHCTFAHNHANDMFGGIYSGTGPTNIPNAPVIQNSIFWGNTSHIGPGQIGKWHESLTTVTYSCVEGGYPGEGNIDANPLFVDPDSDDFSLGAGSPCVDMAHGCAAPLGDRDGNPRYDDKGRPNGPFACVEQHIPGTPIPAPSQDMKVNPPADMGAYERQSDSVAAELVDVIYVNAANAKGPWDGDSWATAYQDLQTALADAYLRAKEVWVAAGTYTPSTSGDRRQSFYLKEGLALYGGFLGNEVERGQRNPQHNETILSGRISDLPDGIANSYHVIVGSNDAIMDGFIITGGNADGDAYYRHGGGMINYNGVSPSVSNCTFAGNRAYEGGAVYNYNLSSPKFDNCTFDGNHAGGGGAIVCRVGGSAKFNECTFSHNYAQWRGGVMIIDYGSSPKFTGSSFLENKTDGNGGGVLLESVAAQLGIVSSHFDNCTFTGNTARLRGGAMANKDAGDPLITGCAFNDNYAGNGGGAMANDYNVVVTMGECTFANNTADSGNADIDTDETSVVKDASGE